MRHHLLLSALTWLALPSFAQTTQTVRGRVLDQESGYPVYMANVVVAGTQPVLGTSTDEEGRFHLAAVPLGRAVLQVAAMGYQPLTTAPLLLVAGKELVVDLELAPSVEQLQEVTIRAEDQGRNTLNNEMTVLSARTFDAELSQRFAGSRGDPARMATNFAGVSGANDGRNDIIIRGNSPAGLLWRLEGVDIPSPNHFGSFGSTGGPVSMLNNNVLAKSDFMTSAFPAAYGNALSGAFDLFMRSGNDEHHEFLGQLGFNGFELGAEGPISRKARASYLVNYRYSTLQAFQAIGLDFGTGSAVPKYQDLSYKLDLPTAKAGRFALWGLGGMSAVDLLGRETDMSEANENELYANAERDFYSSGRSGSIGLSHTYYFNPGTSYRLVVALTHQMERNRADSLTWGDAASGFPLLDTDSLFQQRGEQNTVQAHFVLRHRLGARDNVHVGVMANRSVAAFEERFFTQSPLGNGWIQLKDGEGTSTLYQAYVSWKHSFTDRLSATAGLHGQLFDLNGSTGLEPRFGLRYRVSEHGILSLGYGLHGQTQPLPVYWNTDHDGSDGGNVGMDLTRSHHAVVGYEHHLGAFVRLHGEVYYQYLFGVPVEPFPSTFSMLNTGADFGTPDAVHLLNKGLGRNYGAEITAERTYDKGFYALLTASLFRSEYTGSDGVWRPTIFDGGYVFNALVGKEWKLGKGNSHLVVDLKATYAGGRRYTPIDLDASIAAGEQVLIEERTNAERHPAYFRTDLKLMYRRSGRKATHEAGIDLQNLTGRRNIYTQYFDARTGTIATEYQLGLFPIPVYRVLF